MQHKLTIYLTRHATPDWTRKDIPYHSPPGPPLTEQGEAEAEALGAFLSQADVCQIYTSPLERCQRTAQIAAAVAGAPVETLPALTEMQPGEANVAIRERVWPAFEIACQQGKTGKPVALVTHGSPVSALLSALGMDDAMLAAVRTHDHGNPLPPAGAWEAMQEGLDAPWKLQLVFVPGQSST